MRWRRWLARLNLLVSLVLVGVMFILINFVSSRRYWRADWTSAKFATLSDKTRQVLSGLSEPVSIVVFYQPITPEGEPSPLYPLITDLLKEYEPLSPQLKIEYVDPFRDRARAEQLAKQFEIDRVNLVIVHAGGRHRYLSDTDMAEYDYTTLATMGQPRLKAFTGEQALTSAIVGVTQARQPLAWITSGHGEKSLDNTEPLGLSEFKKALERDNIRAESVTLLEHPQLPSEVELLVIVGPTHRFVEQELMALQAYLERGGRALILLDPVEVTGLEDLVSRWGVALDQDIVVDPAQQLPFVSAANLFVTTYTQHPIVEKMETLMTLFPLARSVRPAAEAQGLRVTPLALTSEAGWGEHQTESTTFQFDDGADTKGPVPIAVAVERTQEPKTRLVVIGDSDFLANSQLPNVGNADLALGAMHWLIGQEQLIGISPKSLDSIKLNLTDAQLRTIGWVIFAALPGLMIALGVGMWWFRRR